MKHCYKLLRTLFKLYKTQTICFCLKHKFEQKKIQFFLFCFFLNEKYINSSLKTVLISGISILYFVQLSVELQTIVNWQLRSALNYCNALIQCRTIHYNKLDSSRHYKCLFYFWYHFNRCDLHEKHKGLKKKLFVQYLL